MKFILLMALIAVDLDCLIVNCLKCFFPNLTVTILGCGSVEVRITLTCIVLSLQCGLRFQLCILLVPLLGACSQ
uniref:Uncharacterized protein n=1 Tax=Arundo donax TaxID=35708 RepID=A0A0A9BQ58_ARUDO